MSKKREKKDIVADIISWSWNVDFPIEELKDILNNRSVKDVHEIDVGSSDSIILLTSKKVSIQRAYSLFNEEMIDRYGGDWINVECKE